MVTFKTFFCGHMGVDFVKEILGHMICGVFLIKLMNDPSHAKNLWCVFAPRECWEGGLALDKSWKTNGIKIIAVTCISGIKELILINDDQ